MKLSNPLTFSLIFSLLFVAVFVITEELPAGTLHITITSEELTDVDPDTEGDQPGYKVTFVAIGDGELPTSALLIGDGTVDEETGLPGSVTYDEYTGFKKFEKIDDGDDDDETNTYELTIGYIVSSDESTPSEEDSEESDSDSQTQTKTKSNTQPDPNQQPISPPQAQQAHSTQSPQTTQPTQAEPESQPQSPQTTQPPQTEPESQPQPSVNEPQNETQVTYKQGQVFFSEIMNASRGGLHSLAQWIELFNNSNTQAVNLKGWQLQIEARDATGRHRHATVTLEDLQIPPNETSLIVTWAGQRKSDGFTEANVYNYFNHHSDEFEQNEHRNMVVGAVGFFLKLSDPTGVVIDTAGNLDGDRTTEDLPTWELPANMTEEGARISLMRGYDTDRNTPLDGTDTDNWVSSSELNLSVLSYWGNTNDIGNPGYRNTKKSLPVALSYFRAESSDSGAVVKWTTESELDNAGFNIYRSSSTEDPFVKVNTNLIQGAGTTSERNEYTWTDTTAKPNIAYYYQIEDVSFSGVRQLLATQRLKGIFSAKNRLITRWSQLKAKE